MDNKLELLFANLVLILVIPLTEEGDEPKARLVQCPNGGRGLRTREQTKYNSQFQHQFRVEMCIILGSEVVVEHTQHSLVDLPVLRFKG